MAESVTIENGKIRDAFTGLPVSGHVVETIDVVAYTVTAEQSGTIFLLEHADDIVVQLPATVAGLEYTFIVQSLAADTLGHIITPAAADKFFGVGAPGDDKGAVNTTATEAIGDSITVVGDGVDGWVAIVNKGVWAKQA